MLNLKFSVFQPRRGVLNSIQTRSSKREEAMVEVSMTVNGKAASGDVEGRTLLVQFLREDQELTGTHVGCDTSQCGACVVHVNGQAVKSLSLIHI